MPQPTKLVQHFHLTVKVVIMCHVDQQWIEALLLVLLGIRIAFEMGTQASVAELVYGGSLRIPGKLLTPIVDSVEPVHLINPLHQQMARPRPSNSSPLLHSYIRAQGPL
jgi:hypothetical protein